jgi:uncharacterized peroxidase-related enzyme
MRQSTIASAALLTFAFAGGASATDDPPPVPLTRPELKQVLEESKRNEPRLKAPAPTPEQAAARQAGEGGRGPGNGLLPPELAGGYFMNDGRVTGVGMRDPNAPERPEARASAVSRITPDPNMTLDYAFKVMLFWIVSRSNNCIYCTGHQENKLTAAGVTEDRIAALDGDWSQFTHAERAAFAFTRKLTVAPHTIDDADIDGLRKHFTDPQVLEIITTVAGFNAMNRWTGPLRLTQQEFRVFLTPTSPKYELTSTKLGPVAEGSTGARCAPIATPRPPLETREQVEAKWEECRHRTPRLPLVDESTTLSFLPEETIPTDRPTPNWARLLVTFPKSGPVKIGTLRASHTKGDLPARLKAELAWVSARADRAWYALACARDRLRELGMNDDAIFAIDKADEGRFRPAERTAFAFARKLTVEPQLIGDDDFTTLREHFSDPSIAEIIHHTNHAVFLNLVTEAAGLPIEEGRSK